jgi:8-oxo-dGTP pyrophosphatase MutT (NUDIX family)
MILARPAARGFEVYMTRRSGRSAFAAGAFVFPGGALDPQDFSPQTAARTLGLGPERVAAQFRARVPDGLPSTEAAVDGKSAAALFAAALREVFEESGILLARTASGEAVAAAEILSSDVHDARSAVGSGGLSFAAFLERRDWFADAGALTLFSHWITPPNEARRFNTHFFFALAPPGQAGLADAVETHEGMWIAPVAALERYRSGTFRLVYPTIKHLERLAPFESLEGVRAFANDKPVLTILPATGSGGFAIPPSLEDAW